MAKSSVAGKRVLLVFPWIFVLLGAIALFFGMREVFRAWNSVGWPAADGEIQESSVEFHRGDKGNSYDARIRYRFVADKQTCYGTRIAFGGEPGSRNRVQALVDRYPRGRAVRVRYKASDPELCVIDPGLKPGVWILPGFGLVFFLLGLFVAWRMFDRRKPPPGTNPWEHRRWRSGLARHQLGLAVCFHFFMGTVFAGIGIGMLIGIPQAELAREKFLWLFVAMFSLTGLGILIWAFISLARWLRFHRCQVRIQTMPGVIGGHFSGEVVLPGAFPSDADVRLELLCEATRYYPGKGRQDSSTSVSAEWSHKQCVRSAGRRQGGHQGGAPFDFIIPYGLPDETDESRSEETGSTVSYKWHLQVTAELPGADLDLKFHVPVFKTAASDPQLRHVPEAGTGLPLGKYLEEQGEKQRIRIESGAQGPVYVGGIRPVIWTTLLVPGIACLIFGGAGMGLLLAGPQRMMLKELHATNGIGDALFMLMPLAFIIVPTIIGVVCSASGVLFACMMFKEFISRRTWIASGMVQHSRRLLGIPLRAICIPCAEVGWVGVNGSMSSDGKSWKDVTIETIEARQDQDQSRSAKDWKRLLKAILKPGSITVATSIPTQRETDKLIKDLRNNINQQRNRLLPADAEDEPVEETP